MPSVTYYLVVPFGRDEDDNLIPLQAIEVHSVAAAREKARIASQNEAGGLAFSRTGDPNTGKYGDAVILGNYGEVDEELLTEEW